MLRTPTAAVSLAIACLTPSDSFGQQVHAGLAGCYRIEIGPWTPALGGNAQYHTPPSRIRLSLDSSRVYGGTGWYQATPAIEHEHSRDRARAAWTATDSSAVRVLWSDGFTGADLRLFERRITIGPEREFFGIVTALSDAIGPIETVPKATVTAWQAECDGSTG